MKAVVIIEVKDAVDVEDFDEVLSDLADSIKEGLSVKRATRADLEEFAEAGALLPNPAPLDWEDDEDEAAESVVDD